MRGCGERDDGSGNLERERGARGVESGGAVGRGGGGFELVQHVGVVAHGAFFTGEDTLIGGVASAGADFDGVLGAALARSKDGVEGGWRCGTS